MTVDPAILIRFDELGDRVVPSDSAGGLADLDVEAPDTTMPERVDAFAGFGRAFVADDLTGLRAADKVSGSTLLNRDITVQAILSWDFEAQDAYGDTGSIVFRGLDGSASEYYAYGLELRVVNVAARAGELRWFWQTVAGADAIQVGGQFRVPLSGFMMLTATRRWISSTEVELAYYAGGQLLARLMSDDGDIGGGTTGTTTVGVRREGGVWTSHLCGVIDELRVIEEALTQEEIAATWERISVIQPRGEVLILETHPPGFPISDLPESRVQRENRGYGHALGFAAAQIENVRANLMPDRAYGPALAAWERITGQHPAPRDSVPVRRARVVSHLRQRAGFAPAAVQLALEDMLGIDVDAITFLAFTNTISDLNPFGTRRWRAYGSGSWAAQSGGARGQSSVDEDIRIELPYRVWSQYAMALEGNGRAFDGIAKLIPTAIADNTEAGIFAENRATGDRIMVGLRNTAASYQVFRVIMSANAAPTSTLIATTSLTTHWLRLAMDPESDEATFSYSLTSGLAGFVDSVSVVPQAGLNRFGFYLRSIASATHAAVDVRFDEVNLRAPYGARPFVIYAYRDPGLPGEYDLLGASLLLRRMRQAHTHAAAIDSIDVLCDTDGSGCDLGPLGGI